MRAAQRSLQAALAATDGCLEEVAPEELSCAVGMAKYPVFTYNSTQSVDKSR